MPRKAVISTNDLEATNRMMAPPEENAAGFAPEDIQVVQPDRMETKAREAKFFEEKVVIYIEPGTEANDPRFIELGHNGVNQFVERGKEQIVKRKFLYSALMAKRVSINCMFGKDANGNEFNRITPTARNTYAARLVSDPNPEGGARWVERVMSEATGMHA